MDPDSKRFLQVQITWIGISLAISIAISILLPFPISLVVIIGVFIGLNYFIRQRQLRKMGLSGGGVRGGSSFFGFGQKGVNYYCMNCGTRHNESRCPNCGSNMKRADF